MLALWEDRLESLPSRGREVPLTPEPYAVCSSQSEGKCGRAVRSPASLHPPAVAWSPSRHWDPVSLISETHTQRHTLTRALSSSQGLS